MPGMLAYQMVLQRMIMETSSNFWCVTFDSIFIANFQFQIKRTFHYPNNKLGEMNISIRIQNQNRLQSLWDMDMLANFTLVKPKKNKLPSNCVLYFIFPQGYKVYNITVKIRTC